MPESNNISPDPRRRIPNLKAGAASRKPTTKARRPKHSQPSTPEQTYASLSFPGQSYSCTHSLGVKTRSCYQVLSYGLLYLPVCRQHSWNVICLFRHSLQKEPSNNFGNSNSVDLETRISTLNIRKCWIPISEPALVVRSFAEIIQHPLIGLEALNCAKLRG